MQNQSGRNEVKSIQLLLKSLLAGVWMPAGGKPWVRPSFHYHLATNNASWLFKLRCAKTNKCQHFMGNVLTVCNEGRMDVFNQNSMLAKIHNI